MKREEFYEVMEKEGFHAAVKKLSKECPFIWEFTDLMEFMNNPDNFLDETFSDEMSGKYFVYKELADWANEKGDTYNPYDETSWWYFSPELYFWAGGNLIDLNWKDENSVKDVDSWMVHKGYWDED